MLLFPAYPRRLLFDWLEIKTLTLIETGNQARNVERAILHSEDYSADIQAAPISEIQTNVLISQDEENQKDEGKDIHCW